MQLKRSALFEDMQYPQRYFQALLKKLDRHNTIGLTRAPQDWQILKQNFIHKIYLPVLTTEKK